MTVRVLMIDDATKSQAVRVVEYAKQRGHWYTIRNGQPQSPAPGNNPAHVVMLNTFRCVFSYTLEVQGAAHKLFRDLSINVPSRDYPHPFAAFTIAELFGFTGWNGVDAERLPPGWNGTTNENEHCIRLVQQVTEIELQQIGAL